MAHDLLDAPSLYDTDVLAWSEQQSAALRERRFGDNVLDWDNLAEEIEGLGKSIFHACQSQVDNILTHFLKIEFVGPADVVPHWRGEIAAFRLDLARDLTAPRSNSRPPGLEHQFEQALKRLVLKAKIIDPNGVRRVRAHYTWEEITDEDWCPEPRYGGASPP